LLDYPTDKRVLCTALPQGEADSTAQKKIGKKKEIQIAVYFKPIKQGW
jgi:hypothetical protein